MSTVLSRRSLALVAVALVVAVAATVLAGTLRSQPAGAQVTEVVVFGFNNEPVTPDFGHVTFTDLGADDGILTIQCTGAFLRGGPNMPASVVTELTATDTLLRILRPTQKGQAQLPVDGVEVGVNCAGLAEVEATPTLQGLGAKVVSTN